MLDDVQLLRAGLATANRAVVETVERECGRVSLPEGGRWYDTRPMLDPREHCGEVIDMAAEALAYGTAAGLLRRHATQLHLVCVLVTG